MKRGWGILGFSAVVLASAGLAQPALAAGHSAAKSDWSARSPAVNWTGLYVGGDISAVFNSARFTESPLHSTFIGSIVNRPAFGVYGGFNYQVAPWAVIGIEGDYNWLSDTKFNFHGTNYVGLQQSRYIAAVTGRFGILLRPDTMIYGKLGPAWFETQGLQGFPPGPFKQNVPAVQSGIGIESLVTPNIALRFEASYTYAVEHLKLQQTPDVYRPGFLLLSLGAAYKFGAPAGWGNPGSGIIHGDPLHWLFPKAPVLTRAPNWTGMEIGGFFSLNGNQVKYYDSLLSPFVYGPFTVLSAGAGGFFGANYQINRFVVGVEISGNSEFNAAFHYPTGAGGHSKFATTNSVYALTARVGWLMTPETLLYVKGGPADIRMQTDHDYWNPGVFRNSTGVTNFHGYQVGVGAETYVLPNVSVRVEGLYTQSCRSLVLQGTTVNEFKLQPSLLSAIFGVALHF